MSENIQKVKLKNIIGKAISGEWGADDNSGAGTPVLRTTNFTNEGVIDFSNVVTRDLGTKELSKKYLSDGDIIIEKSGGSDNQPVGRVVYFEGENNKYLFNNFTALLRVTDKSKWLPKYVFYYLYNNYLNGGTLKFQNKTTGLHNLQLDNYISSVLLPDILIDVQIDIVKIIDSINLILSKRKLQLEKLDELIKSQFIEMFGVENYPKKVLSECCTFIDYRGKTPEKASFGIRLITAKNVRMHYLKNEPAEFVPACNYNAIMTRGIPPVGSVLFTTEAPLGNVCRIPNYQEKFCIGQRLLNIIPRNELNSLYLEYQLASDSFQNEMRKKSSGSTVTGIRAKELIKLTIPVPPIELQNEFARFVEQTDKSKFIIKQSLNQLEVLKKSLMQKYFG